jgi:hypothetical protein
MEKQKALIARLDQTSQFLCRKIVETIASLNLESSAAREEVNRATYGLAYYAASKNARLNVFFNCIHVKNRISELHASWNFDASTKIAGDHGPFAALLKYLATGERKKCISTSKALNWQVLMILLKTY